MAELVGVRPESISRLIGQLQTDELGQFQDRRVQLLAMDEVLQQAGVTA